MEKVIHIRAKLCMHVKNKFTSLTISYRFICK